MIRSRPTQSTAPEGENHNGPERNGQWPSHWPKPGLKTRSRDLGEECRHFNLNEDSEWSWPHGNCHEERGLRLASNIMIAAEDQQLEDVYYENDSSR